MTLAPCAETSSCGSEVSSGETDESNTESDQLEASREDSEEEEVPRPARFARTVRRRRRRRQVVKRTRPARIEAAGAVKTREEKLQVGLVTTPGLATVCCAGAAGRGTGAVRPAGGLLKRLFGQKIAKLFAGSPLPGMSRSPARAFPSGPVRPHLLRTLPPPPRTEEPHELQLPTLQNQNRILQTSCGEKYKMEE